MAAIRKNTTPADHVEELARVLVHNMRVLLPPALVLTPAEHTLLAFLDVGCGKSLLIDPARSNGMIILA